MRELDLTDEDGLIRVTFDGRPYDLDLIETHARLTSFHQAHAGRPDVEYFQGLLALMQEMGLPPCSWHAAGRFAGGILDAAQDVAKKNGPPAASAASTASTPAR